MIVNAPKNEPATGTTRPRAAVVGSIVEGWRRAVGAWWVAAGVLAAAYAFIVPLASLATPESPRHGLAHALADGVGRILDGAAGLPDGLFDGGPPAPQAAGALAGGIIVALFLSGGILDRLTRGRPVGTGAFFSACGVYGVRFLRLAVFTGVAHWLLSAAFRPFQGTALASATDVLNVASGALQAGLGIAFLAAYALVGVIVEFAMVRIVVEDRFSAMSAIWASVRFVRRRVVRVLGLYLANLLLLAGIGAAWQLAAVPAPWPAWARDIVSGSFVVLVVLGRLAFMASEAVFFQGELAHAHYTAAPLPTWPDSAAAEAIRNLTTSGHRASDRGPE